MTPQPAQLPIVAPPKTIADAVQQMHAHSAVMTATIDRLEQLLGLESEMPEMHTVVINPGNSGNYTTTHHSRFPMKSVGVLNPGAVPVFVGIGGVSATPTSRAPAVPAAGSLVLPVSAQSLEFGCDPAVLLAATAVIYVFRFVTVQPLQITGKLS